MQDKADDVHAGVKSTALLFGSATKPWLAAFGASSIGLLGLAGERLPPTVCKQLAGPCLQSVQTGSPASGRKYRATPREQCPAQACAATPAAPCICLPKSDAVVTSCKIAPVWFLRRLDYGLWGALLPGPCRRGLAAGMAGMAASCECIVGAGALTC